MRVRSVTAEVRRSVVAAGTIVKSRRPTVATLARRHASTAHPPHASLFRPLVLKPNLAAKHYTITVTIACTQTSFP